MMELGTANSTDLNDNCNNSLNTNNSLENGNLYENSSIDSLKEEETENKSKVTLAWRNLRYEVSASGLGFGARKSILRRLNGFFTGSCLSAVMGPSGAGKTTLLSALSGASTSGLTGDSEMFIGTSLGASPVTYFIEQQVHQSIIPELTVGQIFRYAFAFKNAGASNAEQESHIKETLRYLLLDESILDRPYGRCSGGEQKRVAIGQELMSRAKADFLLIDEPTTGLDSFAALEVVKCLSRLATSQRMTVVASIHAPNEEILTFFTKVYVLAKGGVAMYGGPPSDHLQTALDDLDVTQQGTQYKGETPIECLIRLAAGDLTTNQVLQSLANRALTTQYQRLTPHLPSLRLLPCGLPNTRAYFTPRALVLSLCRQSRVTFLSQWRLFLGQLLFILALTLLFASFFNPQMVEPDGCTQLATNETTSCVSNDFLANFLLTENINYICMTRIVHAYIFMVTSTLLYASLVKVFRNEHRNRWYSLGVFYLSTSIVAILQIALFSLLLAIVSYFTVSEHAIDGYALNPTRLGHYALCLLICMLFTQSLGQLVGVVIIDSVEIALFISTSIFSMIMLLDDFFFKTDELKHRSFIVASDLLSMKYITRYLIYIFYGLGRCDPETQFSWVMVKNYADADLVPYYITRVLGTALVIRLLTFILMYIKFNTFKRQKPSNRSLKTVETKEIPLDFTPTTAVQLNNNPSFARIPERTKESRELEFEAFSKHKIIIAWRNLSLFSSRSIYEIGKDVSSKAKPILCHLSGEFRFGTLNALMGMSGSGKTSLLKVLNGRCRTRLSSKSEFHLSKFTKISTAFITQEVSGHLMPGLTAKQSLIYASRLKNKVSSGTVVDHEAIARTLLGELNLTDAGDTKVERCSGGERKRLALALELTSLRMPNLICIDEPTSGLDSNSAGLVVSTLRKIAHAHNLTIIASIHQPNSQVLSLFDTLYVLARGGVAVYSGPAYGISSHLSQIPSLSNTSHPYPIEALIKHSAAGPQDPIVRQLSDLTHSHLSQDLSQETQPVPDGVLLNRTRFSLSCVTILILRYLVYIRGHLWKQWLPFLAIYLLYALNLSVFFDPAIALPTGCLSLEDDFNSSSCSPHSPVSLSESQAILYNLRYNLFFSNIFILIVILQSGLYLLAELPLFYNEHRNGWYSTGAFTLTKVTFDLLFYLPILLIYTYIINIYEPVRPGIYPHLLLLLLLSLLASQSLAYIFTVLCRLNTLLALISFISLYMTFQLFSNLFVSLAHLHYAYRLVSHLAVPRFTLEGLVLLQYGFGRCGPGQIQPVLYWMQLKDPDYSFCLLMLLANLALYRLIAIWILIKKVNPPENRRERLNRIENYLEEM